jgi:hypothetical protein
VLMIGYEARRPGFRQEAGRPWAEYPSSPILHVHVHVLPSERGEGSRPLHLAPTLRGVRSYVHASCERLLDASARQYEVDGLGVIR